MRRIGDREIVLAFQVIRVGAIGEGDRVLGPQRDGAAVALDRGIEVALLLIRRAEIAERRRELRVDRRRVFQRFDRAIEVPLPQEVDAAVHVRLRGARRQLGHFPEVRIGTIAVPRLRVRDAAQVVEIGRPRREGDGLVEIFDGLRGEILVVEIERRHLREAVRPAREHRHQHGHRHHEHRGRHRADVCLRPGRIGAGVERSLNGRSPTTSRVRRAATPRSARRPLCDEPD